METRFARVAIPLALTVTFTFAACSSDTTEPNNSATGGAAGMAGSAGMTPMGSGGAVGTGGATGSGGAVGSGGVTGTGGTTGTGGSAGGGGVAGYTYVCFETPPSDPGGTVMAGGDCCGGLGKCTDPTTLTGDAAKSYGHDKCGPTLKCAPPAPTMAPAACTTFSGVNVPVPGMGGMGGMGGAAGAAGSSGAAGASGGAAGAAGSAGSAGSSGAAGGGGTAGGGGAAGAAGGGGAGGASAPQPLEGRCVPKCFLLGNPLASLLDSGTLKDGSGPCPNDQACAPCFNPVDGTSTGACNTGTDMPSKPAPTPYKACPDGNSMGQNKGGGLCVPQSTISKLSIQCLDNPAPATPAQCVKKNPLYNPAIPGLAQDNCDAGERCVPTKKAQNPGYCSKKCSTATQLQQIDMTVYKPGACTPQYVIYDTNGNAGVNLVSGPGASPADTGCDPGELCAPCANPLTNGTPSGACY